MKHKKNTIITIILFYFIITDCFSQVNYDEGRRTINGIQLLQDSNDEKAFHFLPDFPRIAINKAGDFELMCIKYIGENGESSGGLFHALIQFDLPKDVLSNIENELKSQVSGARIVGAVPLLQETKSGENVSTGFKVISSILTNTEGKNPFTSNLIAAGPALTQGGKTAFAAKLNMNGATLLFKSLESGTSDVSVVVSGYYEAKVKAYNAVVTAEMSTIYKHFSEIKNIQRGFTKRQLRDITDKMIQDQLINIDVFDRSEGLGVKTSDMDGILNIITEKLTDVMFNAEIGWAKQPSKEITVEKGQLKGRRKRGFISKVFGSGAKNDKYVSDDQLVIKKREDIKINKFYLNLNKSTTIKVPVTSSGNIGGLYNILKEEAGDKYFKIVNLDDSDFMMRDVMFLLDLAYVESFSEILNSVTVSFKKTYEKNQDDITNDLIFNNTDLVNGTNYKTLSYPRLGIKKANWLDYEYKLNWSLKGKSKTIQIPENKNDWLKSNNPSIVLTPPFKKRNIEIDADKSSFNALGINSCTIRFFVILNGEPTPYKVQILRASDVENTAKINLYHDENEPIIYQVTWYVGNTKIEEKAKRLEDENYLFLMTPTL